MLLIFLPAVCVQPPRLTFDANGFVSVGLRRDHYSKGMSNFAPSTILRNEEKQNYAEV